MAIKSIPKINVGGSERPYGGVVFGLNLKMGFANESSKLMISIVNETGVYETPKLGDSIKVSFSNFTFLGSIYSYEIKETINEKTLEIEIIDNSLILDKYYVVLWKRGFFNDRGKKTTVKKKVEINDSVLVPLLVNNFIEFELKELGSQDVSRDIYSAGKIEGNIIYLGTEKIPNTRCDIPDTEYSLEDLKTVIGSLGLGSLTFSAPKDYKATHEGTLREVLQAWSQDCGVDFYWDYSSDQIKFFSINKGINLNIPSLLSNTPALIEQSSSQSIEGTFLQQAFAYTAKPKESLDVKSFSYETQFSLNINAFPISWFLKNNGTLQSISPPDAEEGTTDDLDAAERNLWGGRTEEDFLQSAFLGYIDENLRDLLCFSKSHFYVCGVTKPPGPQSGRISDADKIIIADNLRIKAKGDMEAIEKISPNFVNHDLYDANINQDLNSKWKNIEQEILKSYGSVYRHTARGGSYFYCSPTMNTVIETNITPEPLESEPNNTEFKGLKIFKRGGTFSHDQNQAIELLGLQDEELIEKLTKLTIYNYDIQSHNLKSVVPTLVGSTLLAVPKRSLINGLLEQFEIDITTGSNEAELIAEDIQNGQSSSTNFNCTFFDENLEKSKCTTLLEEATEKEYRRLNIPRTESTASAPLVEGLSARQAKVARIKLGNKTLRLVAPSDSPYTVTGNTSINAQKVINDEAGEKIFFVGETIKTSQKFSKIDVLIDNVTSEEDGYMIKRSSDIPLAKSVEYTTPLKRSSFKFFGIPNLDLNPNSGLSSLDISFSSEGLVTSLEYSNRPPIRTTVDRFLEKVESQINRSSL
jgi:hypothetical protein